MPLPVNSHAPNNVNSIPIESPSQGKAVMIDLDPTVITSPTPPNRIKKPKETEEDTNIERISSLFILNSFWCKEVEPIYNPK